MTGGRLLPDLGYSLQSIRKTREGASHPDRNAQFEYINATADSYLQRRQPAISVDTKKKELVGEFKNAGREWQPQGRSEQALVHDFPQDVTGKAIPYGIYDMGRNEAWVKVGRDHDTPAFAVASIRRWWQGMGKPAYAEAKERFITADAGGTTVIAHTYGNTSYRNLLTRPACSSWLATFRPGPASGTRLSIDSFVTSRRTGVVNRCAASRRLSI